MNHNPCNRLTATRMTLSQHQHMCVQLQAGVSERHVTCCLVFQAPVATFQRSALVHLMVWPCSLRIRKPQSLEAWARKTGEKAKRHQELEKRNVWEPQNLYRNHLHHVRSLIHLYPEIPQRDWSFPWRTSSCTTFAS